MIGLFLGENDLPIEILKKLEEKKIYYFILDLTKNNKFRKKKFLLYKYWKIWGNFKFNKIKKM